MSASGSSGSTSPKPAQKIRAGEGGRLFIAIDVGDAVRAEVTRVVAQLGAKLEAVKTPPKVTWVKPAALHVTLRFLGETDDAEAERVRDALTPAIAMAPFDVEWRGLGAFPSPRHPRALWMGVVRGAAQLGAVEAEIAQRLGTVDLEARPFLPHLTIGRIKMTGQGVDWPKVLKAVEVRGVISRAERVTLYRSDLSQRPFGPSRTSGPSRAWSRDGKLRVGPGEVEGRGPHYTELVSAALRE